MKKKTVICVISLLFVLILCSCHTRTAEDAQTDIAQIEHPDIIFQKVNYTIGQTGLFPIYITADSIEVYNKENQTIVSGMTFVQKDKTGSIVMTGSCDEAIIETTTNAAQLTGNVILNRPGDELSIEADDLNFDYKNQQIKTDKTVILKYNKGNVINATGLTCDFKASVYEFDKINEGTIAL